MAALRSSTPTRILLVALLLVATAGVAAFATRQSPAPDPTPVDAIAPPADAHRIDVVFVLDTTGSMSGLLEGAKRKIWSIASRMADTKGQSHLRIGLVAYRDRGDAYVTKRVDLTDDLDSVYAELRQFRADGGGDTPESVNQALSEAVRRLSWSSSDDAYKVVFLVGDAPPQMNYGDDVPWQTTIREAGEAGIVVNTVQCGSMPDTTTIWTAIAKRAGGQYAAIAQDGGMVAFHAPMDDELAELNRQLAATVLPYGSRERVDEVSRKSEVAAAAPATEAASRLSYMAKAGRKAVSGLGDLIGDVASGVSLDSVAEDELPAAMQAMEPEEREAYVAEQSEKRQEIQSRVDELVAERDAWVAEETRRRAASGEDDGFDSRVFDAVRSQAAEKGIAY